MHESKHRVPGFEVLACFGELLAESSRYHGRQCCRQLESGKQESGVLAMFLKAGSGIWAELAYAVIITIVAILVIQALGRLAERTP